MVDFITLQYKKSIYYSTRIVSSFFFIFFFLAARFNLAVSRREEADEIYVLKQN